MKITKWSGLMLLLAGIFLAFPTNAQNDRFANVTIETVPVAGNISMLIGSGGNIGVSAGTDGILIIDDQYAPLASRIKTALAALGSDVPKFLLNTHFHGDHTGSNADFGVDSITRTFKGAWRVIHPQRRCPLSPLMMT